MYYVCSPELGGNKEYIYIYIPKKLRRGIFALCQTTEPILGIIDIVERSQIWRFKSFQQYFLSFIEKDRPKYWQ